MPNIRGVSRLKCLLLILTVPTLAGNVGLQSNFDARVLAAQNRERDSLGVEPLRWDPALADAAQQWADHLAATNGFQHAPENHSDPQGENLWAGTRAYYSVEAMVDGWVREKRYFRSGNFPNNSVTGNVADIGHYTQLMWRRSRNVGCAIARGGQEDVLVCRYSEAGNYRGERPF